jgi:hypothetical protein
MATSEVHKLLGMVRNRLWRARFVAAIRRAMWASAALMLLAVSVHMVARRVPIEAVLLLMSGLWAALMLRAAWQRPTVADCALWADRHLGGASAFTTVLELKGAASGHASGPARRWLEDWVAARLPESLRLLADRKESMRLSRPLLSMLVCAALATVVLALPDTAPVSRQQGMALPPSGIGDTPVSATQAPASDKLVSEIASALRSAPSRDEPERRNAGQATATERGKAAVGNDPSAPQPAPQPAGKGVGLADSPSGSAAEPARASGSTQTAGGGRVAGDSRDERSAPGVSRALQGTIAVTRTAARAASAPADLQADMTQLATYRDDLPLPVAAMMYSGSEVAAATPPPATESTRLTPTEASYVQAWMKASARRR